MRFPPQSLSRAAIWRPQLAVVAMMALLSACATGNGDFGEVHRTQVTGNIHDWVGREASGDWQGSSFEVTDDERALRDLGYPLIEAPYDRQRWYSAFGEHGAIGVNQVGKFNRSDYANRLMSSRYNSPSARYAQITDDIRNDVTRLPQFFETAARVLDIDRKRRKSLAYVSDLSAMERDNTLKRMRENESLVSLVRARLTQRTEAYHFALERLVIMTPSSEAVEVERSLNQLQAQIARYNNRSAPTWVREQSLANAR